MAESDVFLHIGLHKTATTFLQEEVFPRLSSDRFHYAGKNRDEFRDVLVRDPVCFDPEVTLGRLRPFMRDGLPNLLSSESLTGDPLNGTIHRSNLLANLRACFPGARVILFLRRQDTWAKSLYVTSIKKGLHVSIDELYEGVLDPDKERLNVYPNPNRDLFLFSPLVADLFDKFGRDNCLVLPYEAFSADATGTVAVVCEFLGVPAPEFTNFVRNPSWGTARVGVYRKLNRFIDGVDWLRGLLPGGRGRARGAYDKKRESRQALTNRLRWVGGGLARKVLDRMEKPFVDKNNVCGRILALCREDNRRLHEELGVKVEPHGYL
jgi:hypothetical protein